MTATVGLIGIGNLGFAIAQNLLGAGHRVIGFRRTMMEKFIAAGGEAAASPREVAEKADLVLTSLPSRAALNEVFCGPEGLLAAGRAGLDVFELSTVSLKEKLAIKAAADAARVTMVDCTISGNPVYIAARNAAVFAGGDRAAFDRWAPVLRDITDKVTWMGPFGTGRLAKFVALYLVAVHTLAAAEAFELASRAGLDRAAMFEAIKGSNATSAMFESRGALMVDRDYEDYDADKRRETKARQARGEVPNRGMANRVRQIERLGRLAAELGGRYPLLAAMNQAYGEAVAGGFGVYDIAEVFEYLMSGPDGAADLDAVLGLIDRLDAVVERQA
ncbi:MAG: NAD(P)-dependent oxidoreductase [Alphaproteobacteria bacterium]|nr:NAD(P)-dependent oxidoreductase [Alphaproteobacteria bacterium]